MEYAVLWQHVISSPWRCVCCVLCRGSLHSAQLPDDGRRPKHVGAVLMFSCKF